MTSHVISFLNGMDIVQDTNVFVAALRSGGGASAAVLERCLDLLDQAYLGAALYAEYEDLISRDSLWEGVPVSREEREMLFDDFCAAARWQAIYFSWRPNLPDESDDHVLELAVACGAKHLVTHNVRDFQWGELRFVLPLVVTPEEHLKRIP